MIPAALRDTILAWHGEAGRAWLDALPGLAARLLRRWRLTAGQVYSLSPHDPPHALLPDARQDGRSNRSAADE